MRMTGVCSIHQSLTPEAITIVKQAITLARRRGHAQVTPIHVATVMLSSPAGLLTSACLKSSIHSHPYQCKALELCFNIALNRQLPASTTSSPFMSPTHHHYYPSLANALMAAFKRAQAHQRRGSIEAQQPPILALKIETEQLVVSILDDPSVSRVMREAGFSSPLLKSYIQHNNNNINNTNNVIESDDVANVIDTWVRRPEKSNVVVVGECLSRCEGVVMEVKERVERGDINIPMELKYVKFLNYPLSSMKSLSREEIDMKLGDIRCLLKGCVGRGVVLYLGDIKWVAEYWAYYKNGDNFCNYCPIEHLIMGLRRLVFGNVENNGIRVWLMCISNFNSLIKCKVGNPSLETLLDLHPLTVPSASLDLSLNLESKKNHITSTSPRLPSWLQKCKEESREVSPHYEKTINLTMSCSPTSSNSISSYEPNDNYCKPITTNWPPMSPSIIQKPELLSNPNSIPNSASSSQATDTCENLEELYFELEKNVPWEKDTIPKIASNILRCRSKKLKQVTWLLFLGEDKEGKLKLAKEIASVVFGITIRSFKSIGFSIKNDCSKKRGQGDDDGIIERLGHAVREDPHRVFFVEGVVEEGSLKDIKRAMESVPLEDAIVIFSCDSFNSASSPVRQKLKQQQPSVWIPPHDDEACSSLPLDLNIEVDYEGDNNESGGGICTLDAVDNQIFFKIKVL